MASSHTTDGSGMTSGTTESCQVLIASYNSPSNIPFTFTQELPTPATSAPADRVAYLSKLRAASAELQNIINKELTQRMEEDKLRAADGAVQTGKKIKILDEGKEEENYGEEVVEDDG